MKLPDEQLDDGGNMRLCDGVRLRKRYGGQGSENHEVVKSE
jgi:hypothetical protein